MSAEIIFLERIVKRSVDEGERGRGGDTIGNKWGTSFTPPFFKFWRFYCIDPPPPPPPSNALPPSTFKFVAPPLERGDGISCEFCLNNILKTSRFTKFAIQ